MNVSTMLRRSNLLAHRVQSGREHYWHPVCRRCFLRHDLRGICNPNHAGKVVLQQVPAGARLLAYACLARVLAAYSYALRNAPAARGDMNH
eukprot:scaffold39028_cov65-Phaeocystis_antarctica.AAC.4